MLKKKNMYYINNIEKCCTDLRGNVTITEALESKFKQGRKWISNKQQIWL